MTTTTTATLPDPAPLDAPGARPGPGRRRGLRDATLRPTFTVAVPRIFERIYDGAQRKATKDGKGRIFDAATISMALVIFLVFSTDLILPRISLPAAIDAP